MKPLEFDVVFISYDEPNAEENFADLCDKVPWTKRIHGVKGSDAAHKAAAELSETECLLTVDADNVVRTDFFNLDLDMTDNNIEVYSWCGQNNINGLRYGNGGLKLWKKDFILGMKTHEAAENKRAEVDFCWENGYRAFPQVFSDTNINKTPFQAWRAGFREGVKMTLADGEKVNPDRIKEEVWWHNLHRLRQWCTVGSHVENGEFAVLGARMGVHMTYCTDWDHVDVRDFEKLTEIYNEKVSKLTGSEVTDTIKTLGQEIKLRLGLNFPCLDCDMSEYALDVYNETINLCKTYYLS